MISNKSEVRLHSDRCGGGNAHPAVNVKVHYFGGTDLQGAIVKRFACPESVAQQAAEWAYEAAVRDFWQYWGTDCDLSEYFPGDSAEVYSEGRSSGWLVVHGLPDVETWDAVRLARWRKFEREVKSDIDYRCSLDYQLEAIEANGWYVTPVVEEAANLVTC